MPQPTRFSKFRKRCCCTTTLAHLTHAHCLHCGQQPLLPPRCLLRISTSSQPLAPPSPCRPGVAGGGQGRGGAAAHAHLPHLRCVICCCCCCCLPACLPARPPAPAEPARLGSCSSPTSPTAVRAPGLLFPNIWHPRSLALRAVCDWGHACSRRQNAWAAHGPRVAPCASCRGQH